MKTAIFFVGAMVSLLSADWKIVERDTVSDSAHAAFSKCYNPGGEQYSAFGMNTYPAEGHSPAVTAGNYRYAIYYNLLRRPVVSLSYFLGRRGC